jgi:hypothetical protein
LIEKLKLLKPFHHFLKAPYGNEISTVGKGLLLAELSRIDVGLGTFFAVQYSYSENC